MRLHQSVTNKLLYWCQNYGGHTDEKKLNDLFLSLRLTPYIRTDPSTTESMVLVETETYLKERTDRQLPTNDIVGMKLHGTVLNKIMNLYKTYSGHSFESKLRDAYTYLDFTPYDSKTTGEYYVVLTEDYLKALRGQQV